jgi:hypothetical protein
MSRAKESVTGPVVNVMAYQDELNTARANLRELRKPPKPRNAQSSPHLRGDETALRCAREAGHAEGLDWADPVGSL